MTLWRRMFGLRPKAWKRAAGPWTPEALAEWKIKQERYMRMGLLGSEHVDLQCSDIRHDLTKAIQEIEVLKSSRFGRRLIRVVGRPERMERRPR